MKKSNKKLTTEEFIQKSRTIHGHKYDYSKSIYGKNQKDKLTIICPTHGEFSQRPDHHLCGSGCFTCGLNKQVLDRTKSQNEILNQFKIAHGNLYDYSKVNYSNSFVKVTILCKKHGEFLQTPDHHKRGIGCPRCIPRVSKVEIEFLNYCQILHTNRQKYLNNSKIHVDGIEPDTNTIYEFLGDYYHGNPDVFNHSGYNKLCHKSFGKLYKETFKRFENLKKLGYVVKYIWENDWNKFKKQISKEPNIVTY